MVLPPVLDEGGDTVMRRMPPLVRGAAVNAWTHPMDHNDIAVAPLRWEASPIGIKHSMQYFHVPALSVMDISPPSFEQHVLSSMDAPSAPTQNMAGFVSEITPHNM